jgi:hypothetical protein
VKREEMNAKVGEELKHIPCHSRGSPQNHLRIAYNALRRRDLARNPSANRHQSLVAALEAFRISYPEFTPSYDKDFFGEN